jgi:hypothetical protein
MSPIDETVPGGAYRGTDGNWHDANGKPIATPSEEDLPKEEGAELDEEQITPGASLRDEFEKPRFLVTEDDKPEVEKKIRKKKS